MKKYSDQISIEKELLIRAELEKYISKSLNFALESVKIVGDSRQDLKTYIHREEHTYGVEFVLKQNSVKEVSKQLSDIDDLMNKMFDSIRSNRVIGNEKYIYVKKTAQYGENKTRIQLIRAEYWLDPDVVENSQIFKTLSTLNKFKL